MEQEPLLMNAPNNSIKTAALLLGCVLVAVAAVLLLSPGDQNHSPSVPGKGQNATGLNVSALNSISIPISQPAAIAVDSGGMIYVSGSESIVKLDASGKQLLEIPTSEPAGALDIGPDQHIYAGIRNRVTVFDSRGTVQAEWMDIGEKARITSVSVSSNRVAVADYGQHCIWLFDREGSLKKRITGTGKKGFVLPSACFDTVIESSGSILAANPGRQRIERYSQAGRFITAWGKASVEPEGFCGCCNPVHIALLPDGHVVTSEKGLRRVKIYSADGRFQRVLLDEKKLGRGPRAMDIAVDSQGKIYILEPVRKQIWNINRSDRSL